MRRSSLTRWATAIGAVVLVAGGRAAASPANDVFDAAVAVPAVPFSDTIETDEATLEKHEPQPSCGTIGATVWYQFTPGSNAFITADTAGSDFDTLLAVYTGDRLNRLNEVGCSDDAEGDLSRVAFSTVVGQTYHIQVGGFLGKTGALSLHLEEIPPPPPPCTDCPAFAHYGAPADEEFFWAHGAGETNIGVNPRTNAVMFQMYLDTARVTWDDTQDPPAATWVNVSPPLNSFNSADPILWTDPATGRTFVVHLTTLFGPSTISYTDDDGQTWIPTEPAWVPPSWDHETIGGGPYAAPLPAAGPLYPSAVYYCAQTGLPISQCARSDDGGLTWGAPIPMNVDQCVGLHGHVVVGPDGTAYVPHKECFAPSGEQQAVIASADNGLTWELRPVPGTVPALSDPVIALDRGGRMYFATSSGGQAVVATSADGGRTWTTPVDVGAFHGIKNTEFPMAVAGDAGRAAVAFYGTTTPGNDQDEFDFDGEWHLYIAFTWDGGATWQTVDATPDDPVQRGCIWLFGGFSPCRNLLDFQGMTVDAQGRVIVGYADGCTSDQCIGPSGAPNDSRDSLGTIARQTTGKRLFASFDPPPP